MTRTQFRKYREQLGLSPAQLALKLGVARNTVYRLENGRRKISRTTEIALLSLRKR